MRGKDLLVILWITIMLGVSAPSIRAERVKMFVTGHMAIIDNMHRFFRGEPLVEYIAVPARDDGVSRMDDMLKFIRLYFPRTYEEMRSYDFIMLASPEYNLFTPKQDEWIYNAICEGAGAINDGSVFSVVAQIHTAWANSLAQRAFPNDAPAVSARGGRRVPEAVLLRHDQQGLPRSCADAVRPIRRGEGQLLCCLQVGHC